MPPPPERRYGRPVNIVFVEPGFPANQRRFALALASVGADVIGVGESDEWALDDELRSAMSGYYKVGSVTSLHDMTEAVRFIQSRVWVDRLEATVEAHTMAAAQVREDTGIPGTSVHTTWLCRDKPSMKQALREAGVPTAASAAVDHAHEAWAFAETVGYPLILKPRDGAGAQDTVRVDNDTELDHALLPQRPRGDAQPLDLAAVRHDQPDGRLAVLRRGRRDGCQGHRGPRHRDERHPHGVVPRPEGAEVLRD